MGGTSKAFTLVVTSISGAMTIATLFAWVGPGTGNFPYPHSDGFTFNASGFLVPDPLPENPHK